VKLSDNLDAVSFARERLGFEPDEQQARVLDVSIQRGILNCCRQWGKSTLMAVKAVHWAYTRAGSNVLVVTPSERQSGEFILKAREFVQELGIRPRGDGYNRLSIRLPNGSRMVGVPGVRAKVRGFSRVSLMLIDEAAECSDEQYYTVRPMLATAGPKGGALWLLSTPEGQRGFFHHEWTRGGEGWVRVSVAAPDNPRISKEFLEEEREKLGERRFRQEYLCEFVDLNDAMFSDEDIEACISDEIPTLF
jgi:hypothetical protein